MIYLTEILLCGDDNKYAWDARFISKEVFIITKNLASQ